MTQIHHQLLIHPNKTQEKKQQKESMIHVIQKLQKCNSQILHFNIIVIRYLISYRNKKQKQHDDKAEAEQIKYYRNNLTPEQ